MSFQQLPTEIVHQIFGLLNETTADLLPISRCCRKFNQIAESILYSTVVQTNKTTTTLLIETLLKRPSLADHIKNITSNETTIGVSNSRRHQLKKLNLLSEEWEFVKALIQEYVCTFEAERFFTRDYRISTVDVGKEWITSLPSLLNWEYLTSLLLLLLPRIQRLSISFKCAFIHAQNVLSILYTASELQHNSLTNSHRSFSNLREILLENGKNTRIRLCRLIPLLELPSLRSFTCKGVEMMEDNVPRYKLHIRQLILLDCIILSPQLGSVLSKCDNLESLMIEVACRFLYSQIRHLFNSIPKPRLTELILRECRAGLGEIYLLQTWPPITIFANLRNVEIPGHFLDALALSRVLRELEPMPCDSTESSPALQQLTMRNVVAEHFMHHSVLGNMDATSILNGVPKLKRIHVQLSRGDSNPCPFWPYFAWRYRLMGIILSFEDCSGGEEVECEAYEYTHNFDEEFANESVDDGHAKSWLEGYEDERKFVKKPQRLVLSMD